MGFHRRFFYVLPGSGCASESIGDGQSEAAFAFWQNHEGKVEPTLVEHAKGGVQRARSLDIVVRNLDPFDIRWQIERTRGEDSEASRVRLELGDSITHLHCVRGDDSGARRIMRCM